MSQPDKIKICSSMVSQETPDVEWIWVDDDEEGVVGSCEQCQGDVHRFEACYVNGDLYCDQCAWWLMESICGS
jgi:hypothetical protein